MQEATMGLVEAVLRTDGTVGKSDRKRLVGLLRDKPTDGCQVPADRLLRRAEVARLLGRSPKSVDRLATAGVIQKVTFPGYQRGAGYRASDIARLVAGEGQGE